MTISEPSGVRERLVEAAAEWRSLALYAFHLAQYGENAPGGDETWAKFEGRLRDLECRERGHHDPGGRCCPSAKAVAAPTACGAMFDHCGYMSLDCRRPAGHDGRHSPLAGGAS